MELVTLPESKDFSFLAIPEVLQNQSRFNIKLKRTRVFDTHSVTLSGEELQIKFANPILASGAYVVDTGLLVADVTGVGDYVIVLSQRDGGGILPHTPRTRLRVLLYLSAGDCSAAAHVRIFKTEKTYCDVTNEERVALTSDCKLMFTEFGYVYEMNIPSMLPIFGGNAQQLSSTIDRSVYYLFRSRFDEEVRPGDVIVYKVICESMPTISLIISF